MIYALSVKFPLTPIWRLTQRRVKIIYFSSILCAERFREEIDTDDLDQTVNAAKSSEVVSWKFMTEFFIVLNKVSIVKCFNLSVHRWLLES